MSSFFEKLNLRPQERRLVVIVGIVVFVVLNVWLIWPHFSDWAKARSRHQTAEDTLAKYRKEIARIPAFQARLKELQSAGPTLIAEEQDLDLQNTVHKQSQATGLNVVRIDPKMRASTTQTNQFFDEETLNIHIESGDKELVDFLTGLASTNSLIRVQNLTLRPAPGGSKLSGSMTLVASYQRKTPAQSFVPPTSAPKAASNSSVKTVATSTSATGSRGAKTNLVKTK
jgi:Tfp pilus assembly protein PilO